MAWRNRRPQPQSRGYDAEHRRAREAALDALRAAGSGRCATPVCFHGRTIYPGDDLHYDHTPDRSGYRGLAHADCNRRDGARRGRLKQDAQQVTSLTW